MQPGVMLAQHGLDLQPFFSDIPDLTPHILVTKFRWFWVASPNSLRSPRVHPRSTVHGRHGGRSPFLASEEMQKQRAEVPRLREHQVARMIRGLQRDEIDLTVH